MRFGSLFSGIGGLDLGLERAGMTCAWQVEIDPYARRVLAKHWSDVPRYDDIRETSDACHHLSGVDLICGGFPCQDISVAGKGAGLAGARSGLWREYRRIVEEVRPAWVLIENVPALRTRGLSTVLGDLHALGYDAEWDGVSASAVGAPHRRDRLFVVAYSQRESLRLQQRRSGRQDRPGALVFGRYGLAGAVADAQGNGWNAPRLSRGETTPQPAPGVGCEHGERGDMAHANGARLALGSEQPPREELQAVERAGLQDNPWTVEPDVGRVAHGVPSRVDRLRCLGNAVVPQVAEYIGRLILEAAQ